MADMDLEAKQKWLWKWILRIVDKELLEVLDVLGAISYHNHEQALTCFIP